MAEKDQDAIILASKNADILNKEKEHNRHIEATMSLWMAFLFCVSCLIAGSLLVLNGHDIIGSTLLGSTIIGVTGAFLRSKHIQPHK